MKERKDGASTSRRRGGGSKGSRESRTRDRLLEVAEHLFAHQGFAGTKIRAIASEAECNIAAVNYHFGGKLELYRAVLHRVIARRRRCIEDAVDPILDAPDEDFCLERLLTAFCRAFLLPVLGSSEPSPMLLLMSREMMEPHLEPSTLHKELIAPVFSLLKRGVHRTFPTLGDREIRSCIESVIGQLHFMISSRVGNHLSVGFRRDGDIEDVARHIACFSAGGIRARAARAAT